MTDVHSIYLYRLYGPHREQAPSHFFVRIDYAEGVSAGR